MGEEERGTSCKRDVGHNTQSCKGIAHIHTESVSLADTLKVHAYRRGMISKASVDERDLCISRLISKVLVIPA